MKTSRTLKVKPAALKLGLPKVSPEKFYGWIPDIPDHRDFLYKSVRPSRLRVPSAVDLREFCSEVENQGQLGSCTANALAGNIEYLDNRDGDGRFTDKSRLFIYYNERVIEHSVGTDAGAMLRDGIKTLHQNGVCAESEWPYDITRFAVKPPAVCYADAKAHCIESYHRIASIDEMLACLAEGFPFVFGFAVYESFESAETARTGVVKMPDKSEAMIGGHAVMAVGYNQYAKRFIVRNSWGASWGMSGYFTMPFEYVEKLADDFWTIRK